MESELMLDIAVDLYFCILVYRKEGNRAPSLNAGTLDWSLLDD
jgi:hypothetical protein